MLKGAQKKMIVIKTEDSSLFEEAYFVIRRGAEARGGSIVEEANRIIESCGCYDRKRKKPSRKEVVMWAATFLGGSGIGGALVGIICMLAG
jgi:hypothetical protein